jgi:hypothetical protein
VEHDVGALVLKPWQATGIADLCRERRVRLCGCECQCLLNMERQDVDQMDAVAVASQPRGVDARTATDVKHICWRQG